MVLHKNKWDRKATKAHERKIRAKAEAAGGVTATGGATTNTSRKPGVGSTSVDRAVGGRQHDEAEGAVILEGSENESGGKTEGAVDESEKQEEEEHGEKGKYSRRKIVDNSWRYEEPEEDPYLKAQEEEEQEPEPDYARMTLGKNQLQVSSDEEQEEEDDLDRAALDNILIRNASAIKDIPGKGKIIQVDRRQFQDIDEKVAKQKAAEAFRQRFIMKAKAKAPSTNGLGVGDDDDINDDIDEFLGGLNLEARPPAQRNLEKTRMPIAGGTGKGLRSEQEDEKWLDEILSGRPKVVKGKSCR